MELAAGSNTLPPAVVDSLEPELVVWSSGRTGPRTGSS